MVSRQPTLLLVLSSKPRCPQFLRGVISADADAAAAAAGPIATPLPSRPRSTKAKRTLETAASTSRKTRIGEGGGSEAQTAS